MTSWVQRLIVLNVGMFLLSIALPAVPQALVLVPALIPMRPWTLVTYMFLHAGPWHLAFNMLALYFFGPRVEARLGGQHFLALYGVSGLVGALASLAFQPHAAIVGASGAVFGVMLGYARYWPRALMYIWGVVPIQARWFVVGMTALSLFGGFGGVQAGRRPFRTPRRVPRRLRVPHLDGASLPRRAISSPHGGDPATVPTPRRPIPSSGPRSASRTCTRSTVRKSSGCSRSARRARP